MSEWEWYNVNLFLRQPLVDDILDFSKLKYHELNLKLTPVDVYTLTATLELNQVIKNIYRSLSTILDAYSFLLGILDVEENVIHVPLIVEDAQKHSAIDYDLDEAGSPAVWCVKNRKELLIFEQSDVKKYFNQPLASPKTAGAARINGLVVYPDCRVAHEINNPTNFVHVGVENLQVDLERF
jgi:hypothetical protein